MILENQKPISWERLIVVVIYTHKHISLQFVHDRYQQRLKCLFALFIIITKMSRNTHSLSYWRCCSTQHSFDVTCLTLIDYCWQSSFTLIFFCILFLLFELFKLTLDHNSFMYNLVNILFSFSFNFLKNNNIYTKFISQKTTKKSNFWSDLFSNFIVTEIFIKVPLHALVFVVIFALIIYTISHWVLYTCMCNQVNVRALNVYWVNYIEKRVEFANRSEVTEHNTELRVGFCVLDKKVFFWETTTTKIDLCDRFLLV